MEVSKRIFNLETETAFSILARANNLAAKGKDIINLGIGQPDFPTPINIQEAAIKAMALSMREAMSPDSRRDGTPSSKGMM